ncbi:MAG: phenylalanine--tRNA ligase subunit beta [Acholeplasmataceae bacterium]|nr:phenylalanine--tRNA ligase subunit beta [Acholeplasmataceae bacterium]
MIITKSQLEKYIKIPNNIFELTNAHITEVESFTNSFVDAKGIVTGKVLSKDKHPNADTLSLTTVDVGDGKIRNIVCGASNVEAGQYVIVALVGAVLPGGFEIKDATIRGVASEGMICSLEELHIENIPEKYADGIFHFPEPVELGVDALSALKFDGFVMELDLTPNNGHLLSALGYAYDLAAVTNQKITLPKYKIEEIEEENPLTVTILDEGCSLYFARMLDVEIKPSPWWLQSELIKRGIEPINNVVDISNFVMFEYGTPLHMFDADLFGSNEIVIRSANDGEEIETLAGNKHKLSSEDLVITNGKIPTAVAGVVGLSNSMILPTTKRVIIEAAHFEPERIQKTAAKIGRSDSSLRFERGVSQQMVIHAMDLAAYLLVEYANGKVYKGLEIAQVTVSRPAVIDLKVSYVNKLLGIKLTKKQIISYLEKLDFQVELKDNFIRVTVPTRRPDIKIEADLVEEIGRLYGYNNIKNKPLLSDLQGGKTIFDEKISYLRRDLASLGLNEIISYSLLDEKSVHMFNNIGTPYEVLKPITEDRKVMRQSLLNGVFNTYKYNISRQNKEVNIFEIGHVYAKDIEKTYLSALINQPLNHNLWQGNKVDVDFYTIKGLLEVVFNKFGISFSYQVSNNESFHPFRQAYIIYEDEIVGILGEIHPKLLKDERVYALEVNLEKLLTKEVVNDYIPVSRYPSIERDIAFVVSKEISVNKIEAIIEQTARKYLVSLNLFDVYEGENIKKDKRSLAYRLVFNSNEKTLESSDVDKVMRSVMNRLSHLFEAEIR